MDPITQLFSHLCGQGRCFVVDGSALPVCQRCLGLYAGAAATFAWLVVTGLWRRGLPSAAVVAVQVAALAAAMMGGLHLIDPNPAWRLACGLWTGHVLASWLAGGASQLWYGTRTDGSVAWPMRRQLEGMAFAPVLGLLAIASNLIPLFGWTCWAVVSCLGALALFLSAIAALVALATFAWRSTVAPPGGAGVPPAPVPPGHPERP